MNGMQSVSEFTRLEADRRLDNMLGLKKPTGGGKTKPVTVYVLTCQGYKGWLKVFAKRTKEECIKEVIRCETFDDKEAAEIRRKLEATGQYQDGDLWKITPFII